MDIGPLELRACAVAASPISLDPRSLAAMRVGTGAAVMVDLAVRLVNLRAHYTDHGVLPRAVLASFDPCSRVSLLALHGSTTWAAIVFTIGFICAAAVIVGLRTRAFTIATWVVVASIQNRNPLVVDHRDHILACALVWGAVLPWDAAWSWSARKRTTSLRATTGLPAIGYLAQVSALYLFAALHKSGPAWRSSYTAVELALSVEYWANPAASWLLQHPTAMKVLTFTTFWFEASVPLLLFAPRWRTACRSVAVGGIILMQVAFGAFLWLGTFPLFSSVLVLGALPGELWTSLLKVSSSPVQSPRLERIAAFVLLLLIGVLNLLSLGKDGPGSVASAPLKLAGILCITQDWNMFSPEPSRTDGWFVVAAQEDGTLHNRLDHDKIADWSPPQSFHAPFATTRELVYFRRLLSAPTAALTAYASSQCRAGTTSVGVYFVRTHQRDRFDPQLLVEVDCDATSS